MNETRMKKMIVSALLLVFSFIAFAFSQEQTPPPTSPDTRVYIIKEGDTLWKISNDVYQDPNSWPLIWGLNPQIKDPNIIRPGDQIILEETKPAVKETESVIRKIPEEVVTYPEVLPPEVTPPPGTQEKYVMEPSDVYYIPKVLNAGFMTEEELEDSGYIDHTRDEKRLLTEDNIVFIKLPKKRLLELKRGDLFSIFRVLDKVKHPVTGDRVGYAVSIVGELEVTSVGAKTASAVITNATDVIKIKDRIRPFESTVKTIRVKKGRHPVVGYIVYTPATEAGTLENPMISENDIVYVDRGYADGVEVGNIFNVLRLSDEHNRGELTAEEYQKMLESNTTTEELSAKGIIYPPDIVGQLVILNAGEYMSTGVITRSNAPVELGDMIRLQVE